MPPWLITGGTGLIGKELLRQLDGSVELHALTRGGKPNVEAAVHWIPSDLTQSLNAASMPEHVEGVIHLAQSRNFRDFPDKSEEIFAINTHSTLRLLEYARKAGAKRFILASSGGVYGQSNAPFTEDSPVSARGEIGFYTGTKLMSEILAESYSQFMDIIILRFFFAYGPGQSRSMLIPRLCRNIHEGNPVQLQGPEGITINPIFVTDAVEGIKSSMRLQGTATFNIGGPDVLSLRQLCDRIAHHLGTRAEYEINGETPPPGLIGAIGEMEKRLHKPIVSFDDGIQQVIENLKFI